MSKLTQGFQSRHFTLIVAILLLLAVIGYLALTLAQPNTMGPPPKASQNSSPEVSVLETTTREYQSSVSTYGSVNPYFSLTLSAKVNGYVSHLSDQFDAGAVVEEGTPLLQLEDSDYQSALASANQAVADAKLALLEQQREAVQAQQEWRSAGLEGEPDSDLVLRQPYVDAARATLASAQAALTSALKDLTHTQIKAPFNAMIVERLVAPGSYVQAGTEIAVLYGSDQVEVRLPLSSQDWQKLPASEQLSDVQLSNKQLSNKQWPVTLKDIQTGHSWTGYITRTEQHLDSETRQRALIVTVDQPLQQSTPLLPGSFVQATIPGRKLTGLWQLPTSALSQRGEIWYLDKNGTLANFHTSPVFSNGEYIYVQPPAQLTHEPQQVVSHPLSSYLVGMMVTPTTSAIATHTQSDSGGSGGSSNGRENSDG